MYKPQDFKELDLHSKLEYLNKIFDVLGKNEDNLFSSLYELIKVLQNDVDEKLLDTTYELLYTSVEKLSHLDKEKEKEKFKNLHEKLKKLQQLEEQDNADDILKQLD